jgi:hypothetical protein
MRNISDLLLQAAAQVPPTPDKRTLVVCFIAFFAISVLIALSPTRFFSALVWWRKQQIVMSPRVVLVYRALGIFNAAGALWEIYMVLQHGRIR